MKHVLEAAMVMTLACCTFAQNGEGTPAQGKFCGAQKTSDLLVDFGKTRATTTSRGTIVSTDNGFTVTFSKAGGSVHILAPQASWDVSAYVAVGLDLVNPGTKPVTLIGSLDGSVLVNSFIHIPPGQSDTMTINILRNTVTDERETLFEGMRGLPGGHIWHWARLNTKQVKMIALHDLDGVSTGQTIRVKAIRGLGRYAPPADAESFFPFVDPFGQFKHRAWPGKVPDIEGLKQRVTLEARDLKQNPGPKRRSQYGGWLEGPRLEATGHFRTEKHRGTWWLVDPDGYLFWSHGITGVHARSSTRLDGRETYFAEVPKAFLEKGSIQFAGANLCAKYGKDWKAITDDLAHARLASWGMNTIANWSDMEICEMQRTPYVVAVHYGGWKEAADKVRQDPELLRKTLRARLEMERGKTSEDPWCIGYFIDNELRFNKVMNPEAYFKIVSQEMKRVAPNKLYLGSRFHGHDKPYGGQTNAVAAAVKHVDVIGINRYRFSPSDLKMYEDTDLPIIIGEFHFGAMDRGMIHPGLRGVANQAQRAYAYEHYLRAALKHPNIVGTHWFQYREQNITGRGDGENYQIGFVDICDTPYRTIIDAARRIGHSMYEIRTGLK